MDQQNGKSIKTEAYLRYPVLSSYRESIWDAILAIAACTAYIASFKRSFTILALMATADGLPKKIVRQARDTEHQNSKP